MLLALCTQFGWGARQRQAAQAYTSQRAAPSGRSERRRTSEYFAEIHKTQDRPSPAVARQHRTCRSIAASDSAHDQAATPLLDAVIHVAQRREEVPLHIPGHKRGAGAHLRLRQAFGDDMLHHDLTELPGLDYLSSPTGAIEEAQRLAAEAFGASCTWFLVNGTTTGIHAAVMATCGPGDTLIAARNCHLSAVSAMVLSGCRPQWVQPRMMPGWDFAWDVTPATLEAAFASAAGAGRPAKAALVVSPTYFGTVSNIPGLAAVCHRHNALLIVDEAHGAHCAFDDRFPPAALASGSEGEHADIVIQSTHKMLGALTQASMLHIKGRRALRLPDTISRALQILQSSSPSYLLMASLDAARAAAVEPGAWDEPLAAAAAARHAAAQLPSLRVLHVDSNGPDAVPALDPLKLTIGVGGLGISGYQAADWLAERGIATELATSSLVLAVFGAGSTLEHASGLSAALTQLCAQFSSVSQETALPPAPSAAQLCSGNPVMEMTPRDVQYATTERVSWHAVDGRICAELLCPYPPGIPAVVPGEVLSEALLIGLRQLLSAGGVVTGAADPELNTVCIVSS